MTEEPLPGRLRIEGTDLEVYAYVTAGGALSVGVNKSDVLVARFLIEGATRTDLDLIAENIAGRDVIVHLGGRRGPP